MVERADDFALLASALDADTEAVAARVRRSVVAVLGPRGHGAGIMLPGGVVVTSEHVVHSEFVRLEAGGGANARAVLAARDPDHDLVLLKAERPLDETDGVEPAVLRPASTLRTGELVLAVGHPWGRRGETTVGVVARTPSEQPLPGIPLRRAVVADVRLAPGNSGGPLVDASGAVIGVNSMIAGGLAVAAPSEAIEALLEGRVAARGRLGVGGLLVPVPALGRDGLLITEVDPEGAALGAGFIPGDVLLGAEGGPDVPAALRGLLAGRAERWRVLRGGSLITIEATPRAA